MARHVALYFVAVVVANLIAMMGPWHSVFSAFVMIGATLTTRDRLHDAWRGNWLAPRMAVLFIAAGFASAWLNRGAARIAVASCVAFIVSETVDAVVYHLLHRTSWQRRVNGSNATAALVDSFIFPTIAFGGFLPAIVALQFLAKTGGGALWGWILRPRPVLAVLALLALAAPSQAQIVSVNGAWIKNDAIDAAAGELFVAAPEVYGLRAYSIISWNTDAGAKPTILARVGHLRPVGPLLLGIGAGVIHVPGDPHLRPSASAIAFYGRRAWKPYAIVAYEQPFGTWDVTTFVGVNWTLYFCK